MATCNKCGLGFDTTESANICAAEDTRRAELTRLRAANADLQERLSASEEMVRVAYRNAALDVDALSANRDEWKRRAEEWRMAFANTERGYFDKNADLQDKLAARDAELAEARHAVRLLLRDDSDGQEFALIVSMKAQLAAEKAARERLEALIFDEREAAEAERRNWNRLVEYTRSHRDRLWWQSFAGAWEAIGGVADIVQYIDLANQNAIDHAERARAQEMRADAAEAGAAAYRTVLVKLVCQVGHCKDEVDTWEGSFAREGSAALASADAGSALLAELAALRERAKKLEAALRHIAKNPLWGVEDVCRNALAGNANANKEGE